ncbi:uncharacterized protein BDZ99DRAFT_479621 [Mytilinidion resinicola]|uniref:J domain-containing protein n=1 Tax=Mytilinidion resinicola TaxID=574789 RepID=A0A6A6YCX0_9PEZI|nr:uncharacterized protein BDZ99DRAFT_479621 [Mytilinidion resinicola]KAF2806363.1 hypothetical protein BDZ99DRAFT_479621 [Mytilinidion resinicola]
MERAKGEEKCKEIQAAFEILGDREKRAHHDRIYPHRARNNCEDAENQQEQEEWEAFENVLDWRAHFFEVQQERERAKRRKERKEQEEFEDFMRRRARSHPPQAQRLDAETQHAWAMVCRNLSSDHTPFASI